MEILLWHKHPYESERVKWKDESSQLNKQRKTIRADVAEICSKNESYFM